MSNFFRNLLLSNGPARDYVENFLVQAVRQIYTIIQITGHNRARQRDKWGALLDEMANLQEEVSYQSFVG